MFARIRTVDDLIQVIRSDDNIRRQVKHALFPGVDLESALQELARFNNRHGEQLENVQEGLEDVKVNLERMRLENDQRFERIDQRFERIDQRFERIDQRFERVDQRFERVETVQAEHSSRLDRIEHDVSYLKGKSFETEYTLKATGIFGSFLRRGHDGTNEVADLLYDAVDEGKISQSDIDQVLASDLIWRGIARQDGEDLILIVEVSWLAELNDVERAANRAELVRRAGLRALGVVAGVSGWTDESQQAAQRLHVVMANKRRVERDSFINAFMML